MGFDAAHAISALSKLALRLMRNANKKPANKKSSPKQDLSEEKFTGSR